MAVVAALLILLGSRAGRPASGREAPPLWETGTFSILGFDPATGEVGGAVQSRVFSVGNGVLWADAEAGIAKIQQDLCVVLGFDANAAAIDFTPRNGDSRKRTHPDHRSEQASQRSDAINTKIEE